MALSDLVEPNLHAIFLWLFLKKWGSPSLCIEEMHTAFLWLLLPPYL
jgi:hypothetical protein